MSAEKHLVAVYGSLLTGLGNHGRMVQAEGKLLGEDTLAPEYTMISLGGFPGLYKEGTTPIKVEVYEVSTEGLEGPLDRLEGYNKENPTNSMYIREKVPTIYGDAWIYFYNSQRRSDRNIVESGDWRAFRNQ